MVKHAVALLAWSDVLGVPNDTVQVFGWLWFGTIAWNAEAPWRYHLGFLRDWWLPVLGLIVYFYSRGLTDNIGLPVHVTEPIRFDEWLTGGQVPTIYLQHAWCGDPCSSGIAPRWYDVAFTTVYSSHFLAGLTIAAVLWVRNREARDPGGCAATRSSTTARWSSTSSPMAPPWMAAEQGRIGPVARISSRGWSDLGLDRVNLRPQGVGNLGGRDALAARRHHLPHRRLLHPDPAPGGAGCWRCIHGDVRDAGLHRRALRARRALRRTPRRSGARRVDVVGEPAGAGSGLLRLAAGVPGRPGTPTQGDGNFPVPC